MMKLKRQWLSGLVIVALCLSGTGAVAAAETDAKRAEVVGAQLPVWTDELGEVPLDKYTREELAKMVDDYWTLERIKNATPLEPLKLDKEALEGTVRTWYGTVRSWYARKGDSEQMLSEPALPQAQNQYTPYATSITNKGTANGKIYFRDPHTGVEHWCSGAAMNSSSKRLVVTAAHCIHGGPNSTWHYNVRFIPNYHWGSQPNGEFEWSEYNGHNGYYAWMPPDWISYGTVQDGPNAYRGLNSDFVFITTNNNANGQRVVDAVGGHGLWTHNGGPIFNASIFGYPWNLASGEVMQACSGTTNSILLGGYHFSLMFGCNFGPGASGGPWLDWYNNTSGIGQLRSVTSFGPADGSNYYISGPLFHSYIVSPLFHYANLDSSW